VTSITGRIAWALLLSVFSTWSILGIYGCSASHTVRGSTQGSALLPPAAEFSPLISDCQPSSEFEQVWRERTTLSGGADYPIGPGDLLRITVVGIDQLENQEVRVTGNGTVTFPFAGTISVINLTGDDLERELEERLSTYIHDPEVDVFNEEDKSRTVRVMGLVNKPGLIVLASRNESIMDTIGEAGGLRDDASQRILFIPAPLPPAAFDMASPALNASSSSPPHELLQSSLKKSVSEGDGVLIPVSYYDAAASPIVMNMHDDRQRRCLQLPARPGDTIIVPVAGNVTVEGWVRTPGAVSLTPGMTVLGAIAAAGGALFSSSAEILRSGSDDQRTSLPVNLTAIQSGTIPDLPLQAGDVVMVDHSVIGAAPYALYQLFGRFSPGVAIPIP